MTKSLKQCCSLLESEQLKLKEILTEAGLLTVVSGNASDVFLELIKQENDLHYKTRQAAMRIWSAGEVQEAIDDTNTSFLKYIADKQEIEAIAEEIHRYFKPKGWIFEEVRWGDGKSAPFYIKTVRKDGVIKKDCVMCGVENRTNKYVFIHLEMDESGNQIGQEVSLRFDTFKLLIEGIK